MKKKSKNHFLILIVSAGGELMSRMVEIAFCTSGSLCVPSQKGGCFVCLQLQNQYSLVSLQSHRMGLSVIFKWWFL